MDKPKRYERLIEGSNPSKCTNAPMMELVDIAVLETVAFSV